MVPFTAGAARQAEQAIIPAGDRARCSTKPGVAGRRIVRRAPGRSRRSGGVRAPVRVPVAARSSHEPRPGRAVAVRVGWEGGAPYRRHRFTPVVLRDITGAGTVSSSVVHWHRRSALLAARGASSPTLETWSPTPCGAGHQPIRCRPILFLLFSAACQVGSSDTRSPPSPSSTCGRRRGPPRQPNRTGASRRGDGGGPVPQRAGAGTFSGGAPAGRICR